MPEEVKDMVVRECKAVNFEDCDVVFSGLDADVAGEIGRFPYPTTRYYHPPPPPSFTTIYEMAQLTKYCD